MTGSHLIKDKAFSSKKACKHTEDKFQIIEQESVFLKIIHESTYVIQDNSKAIG